MLVKAVCFTQLSLGAVAVNGVVKSFLGNTYQDLRIRSLGLDKDSFNVKSSNGMTAFSNKELVNKLLTDYSFGLVKPFTLHSFTLHVSLTERAV